MTNETIIIMLTLAWMVTLFLYLGKVLKVNKLEEDLEHEENQTLELIQECLDINIQLKQEKKSNSANQGWNSKYRSEIKELKETVQKLSTINDKLTKKTHGKEQSNARNKGNR